MSKKISAEDFSKLTPGQIGKGLETGLEIINIATPFLSKAFDALTNFIASLGSKNPNSAKNVRLRLAALEQKDVLQKEVNKQQNARIAALELKAGIVS